MKERRAALVSAVLVATLLAAPWARAAPSTLDVCTASFEEAQLKQRRGKFVAASELFAACAAEKCPKILREDCASRRDAIEPAIPTVTFVVRDPAGKDVDAVVTVDGAPFRSAPGRAAPIDPGPHEVSFTVDGQRGGVQTVVAREGEKNRLVVLTYTPPAAQARPEPYVAPEPPPRESPSLVAPIVVGSIGLIAIGVGVGFFVIAGDDAEKRDQFRGVEDQAISRGDLSEAAVFHDAADARDEAARQNQLVGLVMGGVGLAAIGTAVLIYFVNKPSKPPATAIRPLAGPSFAGAAFGTTF